MRRWLLVSASMALAIGVVVWMHVVPLDGRFVISMGNDVIDPVGGLKLAYTRATRRCGAVELVDPVFAASMLAAAELPGASPRSAWRQGEWLIVETDFDDLEPAIVLLKKQGDQLEAAAVYSGTAAPFNDVQVIHDFFVHSRADAPQDLIYCYEPVGPPFDRPLS